MPVRQHVIIWPIDGLFYWCIYASLSLNELCSTELWDKPPMVMLCMNSHSIPHLGIVKNNCQNIRQHRIYKTDEQSGMNIHQTLNSQSTPHSSSLLVSYGVSILIILTIIVCDITGSHCIILFDSQFLPCPHKHASVKSKPKQSPEFDLLADWPNLLHK